MSARLFPLVCFVSAFFLFLLIVFFPRLKTVEMVIRNTQGAEGVLKQYEDCLREVHTVPSDARQVETYKTKLKVGVYHLLTGSDLVFVAHF